MEVVIRVVVGCSMLRVSLVVVEEGGNDGEVPLVGGLVGLGGFGLLDR